MCHVLIIAEEVLVAYDLEQMLREEGASSFDHAETEDQAVHAARLRKPEVITSDVKLRVGTGPAAVSRICEEQGAIPVLFITATPEDCVGCPADLIFTKPLDEGRIRRAFQVVAPI